MSEILKRVAAALLQLRMRQDPLMFEDAARVAIKAVWDFPITTQMIENGNAEIVRSPIPDAEHIYRHILMAVIHEAMPHENTAVDLCASILANDETIERVARTMCRSSYDGREVWDVIGPMKQNAFRRDVRQVMAAMVEVLTA